VASALSGGVDSTAVYCMLSHLMKKSSDHSRVPSDWQKAFSITFPGSQVDESKYIQSVLSQTKGQGIMTAAKNDDLVSELIQSTSMGDFISGTPLPCLTYVYKAMHQHKIVVSMDGHGADEYLYGYSTSVMKALAQAYFSGNNKYASTLENTLQEMNFGERGKSLIASAKSQAEKLKGKNNQGGIKSALKSLFGQSSNSYQLPSCDKDDFFSKEISATINCSDVGDYYRKNENAGEQQLLEEFHYIDLPYNLRDFDRGAMQHRIEIRMPFMDYRLVTFAMSLPQESKLNHGFTKYILRESMKGIMPEDIRTRKLKIGLGAPLADWFNGPLNNFLLQLAEGKKLKETSFLNKNNISETINNNCRNKSWNDNNALAVWPVINYLLLEEN
jgi:asparagine synthase (glutamine-hydrolysing)